MMSKRVTILDIAREAGVSRQTVVRALGDQPRISPDTRRRILEIAARMDYRPNRAAQALVGAPTMMLSMVIGDLRNPFFAEVAIAFETVVRESGYSVMLMRRPPRGDLSEVTKRMASHNVDGAVVFPHALRRDAVLELLAVVPRLVVVGAGARHRGCSEVLLDEKAAVSLAVDHLTELGRTATGVVSHAGRPRMVHPRARVLERCFPDAPVVKSRSSARAGYEACLDLLELAPEVDAIVAFNDIIGLGVLRALADRGRRVPKDVTVVSVDGTDAASMSSPSLTSVTFGPECIGREAARLIVAERIEAVRLAPELVIGESS